MRVLVIGLGKIAFKNDVRGSELKWGKSHLGTLKHLASISKIDLQIVGIDPKEAARRDFAKMFVGSMAFPGLSPEIEKIRFDLTLITSPIETLFDNQLFVYRNINSRYVIVEKPGVNSIEQLFVARKEFYSWNYGVAFPRVFLPSFETLKKNIKNMNVIKNIFVNYSGTFLNTASHYINLIDFLLDGISLYANMSGRDLQIESKYGLSNINFDQTFNHNRGDHELIVESDSIKVHHCESTRVSEVKTSSGIKVINHDDIENMIGIEVQNYFEAINAGNPLSMSRYELAFFDLVTIKNPCKV